MRICGIDVGKKGGVAFLTGAEATAVAMPTLAAFIAMLEWHAAAEAGLHVFIEKAQSFPGGQGIASAFNYGQHFGELLGVIQALGIAHTLVRPAVWSKMMHAGTKDGETKARSLEAAQRLFPRVSLLATPRCKKPHDGIYESLLIAEYGRRILSGQVHRMSSGTAAS